jgi:hypothetical protein
LGPRRPGAILQTMSDDPPPSRVPAPASPNAVGEAVDDREPPVVARLVIEIRSDGSRTIARGAVEDLTTGQRTAIEARGTTPLALVASLSRSIVRLPALARRAARALLPGKPRHP